MIKDLGGTLIVRDGNRLDYCWREALASLLAVCEEVVVLDGMSGDGTGEELAGWVAKEPRLRLITRPWEPTPLGKWLSELTNEARKELTTPMHVNLQADEVLHEGGYAALARHVAKRHSVMCRRYNFWKDAQHVAPVGRVCSSMVIRVAPTKHPSMDDAESLMGVSPVEEPAVMIGHYGFLRKPMAFVEKSREMQKAFFNTVDPIVEAVAEKGMGELVNPKWPTAVRDDELVTFYGTHSKWIGEWLKERGYTV